METLTTSTSPPGGFQWIEDDGLLRDEGVVFGLTGDAGGLAYKEECIRAYFRLLCATTARRRAAITAELRALEPASDDGRPAAPGDGSPIALGLRHSAGILGAAAASAGIGVLVYEQLSGAFARPGLVTLGVVCTGLFTASLPVSLLFVSDRGERPGGVELWKVRLAELGVPFVAAAFVASWAWERIGLPRAIAMTALLFFVFIFAGKQILSGIPWLGGALARPRQRPSTAEPRRAELQRELATLRSDEEWDAIRDAKLALFLSEYELASAPARNRMAVPHISPPHSIKGVV